GYGTLPRLLQLLGSSVADGVDAVVITHHHPDHMVDLHGLFRARWFGARHAAPLPLYAPHGVLEQVMGLEEDDASAVTRVFDWHPLPAEPYQLGRIRLESRPLPHFVPNAGVRLSASGLVVAYTGDTGPDPALSDLGRDADLFIVEATDRHQQTGVPPSPAGVPQLHLCAHDAGRAAAAAGARRLMLTHFWPGNDRGVSLRDAQQEYDGDVVLAEEGLELDVTPVEL
ncbi:MAG: MBL fold metallo-hydrolase, partial [Nocardioidaceae bacterium]